MTVGRFRTLDQSPGAAHHSQSVHGDQIFYRPVFGRYGKDNNNNILCAVYPRIYLYGNANRVRYYIARALYNNNMRAREKSAGNVTFIIILLLLLYYKIIIEIYRVSGSYSCTGDKRTKIQYFISRG